MCPLFSLSNVLYILAFPKFFSPKRCKLRVSVLTMIKRYKLGAGWLEALFSVWEYWIIDVNLIHIHIYFKVGEEDKTEKVCLLSATLGDSSFFILVCILVNLRLRRCIEWPWIIKILGVINSLQVCNEHLINWIKSIKLSTCYGYICCSSCPQPC